MKDNIYSTLYAPFCLEYVVVVGEFGLQVPYPSLVGFSWVLEFLLLQSLVQACSQDRFWGVQNPQKVDLLDPKSGLF